MKYSININQKALVELNNETGTNLDLKDATIISFFKDYTHFPKVKKQIINGDVFYWVSYQWIIDENPLLEIENKDVLGRRIEKICNTGILQKFLDKKDGNKVYLAFGETYQRLITDNHPTYSKQGSLPTQKSEPLPTQKSDNYNTNKTEYKKTGNKENTVDFEVQSKTPNSTPNLNINSLSDFFKFTQDQKEDMEIFKILNNLNVFFGLNQIKITDLEIIKETIKSEEYSKNYLSKKHWGGWIGDYQTQKAQDKVKQFTITKDPNFGKTKLIYEEYLFHYSKKYPNENAPEFTEKYYF